MSTLLELVLSFAGCVLLCGVVFGATRQRQRRLDQLNAALDEQAENWAALTPDDRKWLLDNGAEEPSLMRWELR